MEREVDIGNIGLFFIPLFAYLIIVLLVTFGIFPEYIYQFHIMAIVLGVICAYVIKGEDGFFRGNLTMLILIPLVIAAAVRLIPYTDNSVPLGYDPGIYKYEIERYWKGLPELIPSDLENWDRQWSPPGLFIITSILHLYGFDSFDQYNFLFIFFDVIVVLAVYSAGKRFFSQEAGIIAALFYSVSLVQFKAFELFYYKNVVSIFLALIALHMYKSRKYIPLIITGAVVGAIHRPTFLIFGLVYLLSLISDFFRKQESKDILRKFISGCLILLLAIAFYIPVHSSALLPLKGVVESTKEAVESLDGKQEKKAIGGGHFISSDKYHYSAMYYLPLAVSGALVTLRMRKINPIILWGIVTAVIVYLELFFFKRFIIHLDISLVILSGAGFYYLVRYNKILALITLSVLALTAVYSAFSNSYQVEPLIDRDELNCISVIQTFEEDAYAMSTHRVYSPWIIGYSGKKTIAPGLFEYDKWTFKQWKKFWYLVDEKEAARMLAVYHKPIYIYLGHMDGITNRAKFRGECFEKVFQRPGSVIYRFKCYD